MKTRSNGVSNVKGFYSQIKVLDQPSFRRRKYKGTIKFDIFQAFINSINVFILKGLKRLFNSLRFQNWVILFNSYFCILNKRSINPIQRLNIDIDKKFYTLLKNIYNLGYHFKLCDQFIIDFSLSTKRTIKITNENFTIFSVAANSFKMKINKPKVIEFLDEEKRKAKIHKNPSMSIQFRRENTPIISSKQLDILQRFNS